MDATTNPKQTNELILKTHAQKDDRVYMYC